MLSSSRNVLLKLSKTISPPKLFPSDCIALYKRNSKSRREVAKKVLLVPPPPRLSGQKNGYKFVSPPPHLSRLFTKKGTFLRLS